MTQKSGKSTKNRAISRAANSRVATTKTKMHVWKKIAIGTACLFLVALGVLIWWRATMTAPDKTVLNVQTNNPIAMTFADDNAMSFVSDNNIPDVNNSRELSPIQPLVISYDWKSGPYQGAFKMDLTDADLAKNVKISPFIRGKWTIRSPYAIAFTPESDWPADKKFTVKINSAAFNSDVEIDSRDVSFTTEPIIAKIDSFNTYPVPSAKKSVMGIAVISFNYPIDARDFNDKINVKLDDEKLDFDVKFDRFNRTVFITTAPVAITDAPQVIRLKLNRIPAFQGNSKTKKLTAHTTIASADNIFKVASITTTVADDNDNNAQQLILINTTAAAAANTDWGTAVNAYLLPKFRDADEKQDNRIHKWAPDEITPELIKKSKKLAIKPVDFVNPNGVYQYAFSYDVSDKNDRFIYVSVNSGIKSSGGFVLKNPSQSVLSVPYPERTVKIAGSGALLSMAGDKKLGIMARGGADVAYVNLYKVKSSEINHLISQVYNVFAPNIEFKSWAFGVYDMSVVFQKRISFANASIKRTNYASVDLGDYLDKTGNDKTGIFIIQTGASESAANYNDKRLILLTDMGIIRKVNLDETSSVFVARLSDGTPAGDTEISVLGRNGNPVWTGRTNAMGRADIPKLAWSEYKNAREPVAIVARRGNDVSFIPYNAYSLRTDYSKFAIDGVYASDSNTLNAFLFSDRGIYRPGEDVIIGGIVKDKTFKSLSGIPVKFEISDPRGRSVLEKTFSLKSDGMFDIKYPVSESATLGDYSVHVYSLNSKNRPQDMLGTTTFRVEEFVADTLKITANIIGANDAGWVSPDNLQASVSLRNLFGTPATNRKISAHATLRPINFTFTEYPDYIFADNFISDTGLAENTFRTGQTFTQELADVNTDDNGIAKLNISFNRTIPAGKYMLSLNIRGYEGDSGRSVQTNITTRASDAKYLIGYRAKSDLGYINRDAVRSINVIAVDHTGTKTTATDLTLRLVKRENLTSLVKDYNDYYKYQTVTRDKIVSQEKINISDSGRDINLNTKNGGTYFLQILDASDKILMNVKYFVAASENVALQTDTPAEMKIKLNAGEYAPGDDIAINITAPYAGSGLITIERDRVYAYRWFQTDKTSSIQHITVPDGFSGTGYVNVSFVRDLSSRDIFTTPYAYAVAPFATNIGSHKIGVKLSAPKIVRDDKLTIEYETNQPARLMLFAVNTGILQVAKYQIPNPLAHFFKKSALQVDTFQILSLLLPEYKILHEFAKTGGGDFDGGSGDVNQILTNPFGRRTQPPVAFFVGPITTTGGVREKITFDIPQYFNGDISVFAVAANDSAVGSADTNVKIQSPVVISTTAPLMAAPGDTFNINTVITNLTDNDDATRAIVSVRATDNITLAGTTTAEFVLNRGAEKLLTFGAVAGDAPGNAEIVITAKILDKNNKIITQRENTTTMSIRPTTTYTTKIRTGLLNSKSENITNFQTDMYAQDAVRQLFVSANASALIRPLFEYLAHYDFPCTEQIVSRTLPYVLAPNDAVLGTTFDKSAKIVDATLQQLKNRQNDDGSFNLWTGGAMGRDNGANANTAYLTSYVVQFLTLAQENGFNVSKDMLGRAIDYLRDFAGNTITDDAYANSAAYAIYVITQNGYVSTSYIDIFEEYANKNMKNWESGLSGAYIAASYKMLKQDEKADRLINKFKLSESDKFHYVSDFDNNVANNAIYYYLMNRYFHGVLPGADTVIMSYINGGEYSSFTSAAVIMGLGGRAAVSDNDLSELSILADGAPISGNVRDGQFSADIPATAKKLTVQCPKCTSQSSLFYTLMQQGYPTESHTASNGIEIIRHYYDINGNRITSGKVGDTITVKIFIRTRGDTNYIQNGAIVDLMPGGFIPDTASITGDPEFYQVREDRVVIFSDFSRTEQTFTYSAQLGAAGTFAIPAIQALNLYNPQINATGETGTFTVYNDAEK